VTPLQIERYANVEETAVGADAFNLTVVANADVVLGGEGAHVEAEA